MAEIPRRAETRTTPRGRDHGTAQVRHWKLHEARGFWKLHPSKEDLVYALLEYMDDKEQRAPTRPSSGRRKEPAKAASRARKQSQVDTASLQVSVRQPHPGDPVEGAFGTRGSLRVQGSERRPGGPPMPFDGPEFELRNASRHPTPTACAVPRGPLDLPQCHKYRHQTW